MKRSCLMRLFPRKLAAIFAGAIWLARVFPGPAVAADDYVHCMRLAIVPNVSFEHATIAAARKAFERAGVCVALLPMPVRRSEQILLKGELDGDLLRTPYWANLHGDRIVKVPTPVAIDRMVAISLTSNGFVFGDLPDLAGRSVVISAGHRWAEAQLRNVGIAPMSANSTVKMFELLRVGRVDVGFLEASLVPEETERAGLTVMPVAEIAYHIVLHNKHAALVPKLDAALRGTRPIRH